MQAETKHLWLKLCEHAANEQNPEIFRVIARDIRTVLKLKTGRLGQISTQPASSESHLVHCSLCHNLVPLESSRTDEDGHAVHEECYVLRLRLEQAITPPRA